MPASATSACGSGSEASDAVLPGGCLGGAEPASRWVRLTVRPGERGPLQVEALTVRVRTKQDRRLGPEERLVVMRTVEDQPQAHYALSNAEAEVSLAELVRVRLPATGSRRRWRPAREKPGWRTTRSGAGWAGTTT